MQFLAASDVGGLNPSARATGIGSATFLRRLPACWYAARPFGQPSLFDPVSLASLIVAVATLAWTIYNDQRTRTPDPAAQLDRTPGPHYPPRPGHDPLPLGTERITEIIATEITRQADRPR